MPLLVEELGKLAERPAAAGDPQMENELPIKLNCHPSTLLLIKIALQKLNSKVLHEALFKEPKVIARQNQGLHLCGIFDSGISRVYLGHDLIECLACQSHSLGCLQTHDD
jgi:hypothetical protein